MLKVAVAAAVAATPMTAAAGLSSVGEGAAVLFCRTRITIGVLVRVLLFVSPAPYGWTRFEWARKFQENHSQNKITAPLLINLRSFRINMAEVLRSIDAEASNSHADLARISHTIL